MSETGGLAARAHRVEAERFVGREQILDRVQRWLAGEQPRILVVHGPAGVGKSALGRAIGRRVEAIGRNAVHISGQQPTAEPAPPGSAVIFDGLEHLDDDPTALRDLVVTAGGEADLVVVIARRLPAASWADGDIGPLIRHLALPPLSPPEVRSLLAGSGIGDTGHGDAVVRWSGGFPMAVLLAVDSLLDISEDFDPGRPGGLDDQILARLGGPEIDALDPEVLDVAGVAPVLDTRLLSVALPGRPVRDALSRLRLLDLAQTSGPRVVLHPLAAAALRARIRRTAPERYRTLVGRVADHLRTRALTEDPRLLLELGSLVENPALRVGFEPSTTRVLDVLGPGDLPLIEAHLNPGQHRWTTWLQRWIEDCPHLTVAVRRLDGVLVGGCVIGLAEQLPDWAPDDPNIGPLLDYAAAQGHLDDAAFMVHVLVLDENGDPAEHAETFRVGNTGALLRVPRVPRHLYTSDVVRRLQDGSAAMGFVELPELRRNDGDRELLSLYLDYGPDGAVGALYALIAAEQKLDSAPAPLRGGSALLDALRYYRDERSLLRVALGHGEGIERVESVRQAVRDAIDAAFGPDEPDQRLKRALELAYLDPIGGHGVARHHLHLSRSSYYRLLQRARDQMVTRAVS